MAVGNTVKIIWQNRRHFKMQMFGIMVFIIVAVFVLNLVSIKTRYDKLMRNYMSSTTQFTSSTQMSLSGIRAAVSCIYVSSDKTKCFIALSYETTQGLTTDASQYQVFVSDVNDSGAYVDTPDENITGEIYMFGSSGIMGIYLQSDVPFVNTMKELILRSYAKYTSNTSPYVYRTATDASYDQCHIYFNPGSTGSSTIDFLENHVDGTDFSLVDIKRQITTISEEENQRQLIRDCYEDISSQIKLITEYRTRLSNDYGVELPDLPDYIAGDSFGYMYIYDSEGNVAEQYVKFVPATIVPGGTEYDWYVGSIFTGYLKLVPGIGDMTAKEYLNALEADRRSRSKPVTATETWYYKDGTEVSLSTNSLSTTFEKEVVSNIKAYETALDDYITLKTTYQTEYLPNLIELEYDTSMLGQAYTVRRDENTVITY